MATTVRFQNEIKPLYNFWNAIHFHPTDAIEDDWGKRILDRVSEDKAAGFVRMYAMLEDIVSVGKDGQLEYDFSLTDERLDYMIERGFRILLSYNFIPPCIAENPNQESSVSKNKTRYKGKMICTSKPNDYVQWEEICYRYTQHLVERYGEDLLSEWYLQCYNEPDYQAFFMKELPQTDEGCLERSSEYCKLYKGFANGVLKASKRLRLGGPALAGNLPFLERFMDYVKENNIQLDYICFHSYGTTPQALNNGSERICTENNLKKIREITDMVRLAFPNGMPIFVDEWGACTGGFCNVEDCPRLIWRETASFAVYYGRLVTQLVNMNTKLEGLMICLSGQHEMTEDFSGFRNMFTLNHIAKPIYNAFCLMNHIGGIQAEAETDTENMTVLAAKNGDCKSILITYDDEFFEKELPEQNERIHIEGLDGKQKVTVYRIDPTHLNPYGTYLRNHDQKDLSPQQIAVLREEGSLKASEEFRTDGDFILHIPGGSFILIEIG